MACTLPASSLEEMANKEKQKLYEKLRSKDKGDVLDAIENLRAKGDEEAIPYLVDTLVRNEHEDVKNAAANFLYDIKSPAAVPSLVSAIQDPDNLEYQHILVQACWQSGLNFSPYLNFFVDLAIISDYHVCLECLTVIENMDGPFEMASLERAIRSAREGADDDEEGKFDLLNSIWEVLVDFRENTYGSN